MPPLIFVTSNPACSKYIAAFMLRPPDRQMIWTGRDASSSFVRSVNSDNGTFLASAICPLSYSSISRTSIYWIVLSVNVCCNWAVVICFIKIPPSRCLAAVKLLNSIYPLPYISSRKMHTKKQHRQNDDTVLTQTTSFSEN